MAGKLIILDGSDGSGKETQAKKLYERLLSEGHNIIKVEFPDYESQSSALVKMYLNGDFGKNPRDINPYAASTFYAVDRFASYKMKWEKFYKDGGIVLSDRYTTSNMIHQASKIEDEGERDKYLSWLWDLEFNKMGLPVPDKIIFLDMPPECSRKLMEERNNKFTGEAQKDIHEGDYGYLISSYNNALRIADKYSWVKVSCGNHERIKEIDEIHQEVYKVVADIL